MSAEDKNKSTTDTLMATPNSGLSPKKTKIPVDTTIGKKQTENSSRMYRIDTTDFLYLVRSIRRLTKILRRLMFLYSVVMMTDDLVNFKIGK